MNLTSWESLARRTELYAIAVVVAISVACGGDDGNGGGSGGGDPVPVPSGARLGWSQTARSFLELQSMTFRLYVDSSPNSLSAVTCGQVPVSTGYDCSGRLPSMSQGRHVLKLASVLNGIESDLSQPLTIMMTASSPLLSSEAPAVGATNPLPRVVCAQQSPECFDVRVLATGLMDVTALSTLPDDRLLFIEEGSQVRIIEHDVLLPEPALVVSDSETRFVGLAVDTSFSRTRFVFIASAAPGRNNEPKLTITRYRELAGSLGEGASIVTGLPFRADALAPLSIDGQGLLYVALPAPASARAATLRDGTAGGAILRFKNDGTVPPGNWRESPAIAYGYALPTGLAIDTVHKRLWLAGQDPALGDSVSTLSLTDASTSGVPRLEAIQHSIPLRGGSVTSIALLPKSEARQQPWLLATDGQLLRGIVGSNGGVDGLAPLTQEESMSLRAVAEGPGGSLYVVAGTTELSIVRLGSQ